MKLILKYLFIILFLYSSSVYCMQDNIPLALKNDLINFARGLIVGAISYKAYERLPTTLSSLSEALLANDKIEKRNFYLRSLISAIAISNILLFDSKRSSFASLPDIVKRLICTQIGYSIAGILSNL